MLENELHEISYGMVSGTDANIPNPQSIATRYADSAQIKLIPEIVSTAGDNRVCKGPMKNYFVPSNPKS
jgi:hypothetical protein